ncbi:MAG: HAMP domain-containing histidine kinase [Pseudomonadales bacterium]|nr:HAMP domain-containing histidine kinase [Pseudomonadales bacterium]
MILGYTSLLLDEDRDFGREEPRDLVGRIERSARQLAAMLEDTLSVGLDSSVKDVRMGDVILSDVLRDIEVETREPRQEAGLAYAWDISPQLPKLHSDGDKIKLILKNLVSNAVKFTEAGGIFVRATPRDTGVEIAVEDTGVGIGEEAQKIIFEPFRQIDRTQGRAESGTGLGLHVVRRMVDMLGGKISVESEIGQGATFRVWLPAPGAVASA